jgi:hypothetical protein
MINLPMNFHDPRPKSSRYHLQNGPTISGQCDLDLGPPDLKINRGHLAIMKNHHLNFHDPGPKHTQVFVRKRPKHTTVIS